MRVTSCTGPNRPVRRRWPSGRVVGVKASSRPPFTPPISAGDPMKLILEQAALNKALDRATSVVERRNTIPILANVLIDATGDGIWLTATDLAIESRVRVAGVIETPGRATVSATLVSDMVRNAPPGAEVVLELIENGARLAVSYGRSRFRPPVLPVADFPVRKEAEAMSWIEVDAIGLAAVFGRTAVAMGDDGVRHYLNGVYLHTVLEGEKPVLRGVATCTGRLMWARTAAPARAPAIAGVIVPKKTVGEFTRALNGRSGPVRLGVSSSEVCLAFEDLIIRSKVVDGEYVEYARVVPNDWSHEIVVDRGVLEAAAKRVALVSTDKVRSVEIKVADGVLTLQARSLESGEAVEEIEVETTSDDPRRFCFNARYLLDALGQTDADYVALRSGSAGGPVRLEPADEDPEAGEALSILMPMAA